jgi:hypothetical protein
VKHLLKLANWCRLGRFFGSNRFWSPWVRDGDPSYTLTERGLALVTATSLAFTFAVSVSLEIHKGSPCGWYNRGHLQNATLPELLVWSSYDLTMYVWPGEPGYP